MASDTVSIPLTREQAIVLFEWLSREDSKEAIPTAHVAEQKVLWTIEAWLERTLVEPLQPNYNEILEAARACVSAGGGTE